MDGMNKINNLINICNKKTKTLVINFYWWLNQFKKCLQVYPRKIKDLRYKVTIPGEVVETNSAGWVRYGCLTASIWLVENNIYDFDIINEFISNNDYKVHFVFGFNNPEDAIAFKLKWL